ncbi:MAG: hypothetical protein EHM20_00815 [Alphaproteobacteria bacterium]|nr:MAG: hypothetical protein EHM20_00815 [Alphaproteobacteria bacterium]
MQRDAEYNQLVEALLNGQRDRAVAITTTLRGAGGYWKTTLAKAVCYDPKITKKFFDGILWVTLGEKPDNLTLAVYNYMLQFNLSSIRKKLSARNKNPGGNSGYFGLLYLASNKNRYLSGTFYSLNCCMPSLSNMHIECPMGREQAW